MKAEVRFAMELGSYHRKSYHLVFPCLSNICWDLRNPGSNFRCSRFGGIDNFTTVPSPSDNEVPSLSENVTSSVALFYYDDSNGIEKTARDALTPTVLVDIYLHILLRPAILTHS